MFDTVVLGGTIAATGFCSANQGKNLIVSSSVYLEDYSPALRFAPARWSTEAGKAFYETLPIRDGTASLGEVSQLVYRRALERGWTVLYQTFVKNITPREDGYMVTVQNWDGTRHIPCRRVLDTRPVGAVLSQAYHCLVEHAPQPGDYGAFSILPAYWAGQSVLRVPLDPADGLRQGRRKLQVLMEQQELRGTKLILMGLDLDRRVHAAAGAVPSCNYENMIESYEQGYAAGLRMEGGAL